MVTRYFHLYLELPKIEKSRKIEKGNIQQNSTKNLVDSLLFVLDFLFSC